MNRFNSILVLITVVKKVWSFPWSPIKITISWKKKVYPRTNETIQDHCLENCRKTGKKTILHDYTSGGYHKNVFPVKNKFRKISS